MLVFHTGALAIVQARVRISFATVSKLDHVRFPYSPISSFSVPGGGNMSMNSLLAVFATWLNASQRSRIGVVTNRSAMSRGLERFEGTTDWMSPYNNIIRTGIFLPRVDDRLSIVMLVVKSLEATRRLSPVRTVEFSLRTVLPPS